MCGSIQHGLYQHLLEPLQHTDPFVLNLARQRAPGAIESPLQGCTHLLYAHTHVLCCSAPPWISQAVCWKAAIPLHLVTWFPRKQTGVRSPRHCAGAGKLSASPLGTKDAFSGTGISLPLKAACGDVKSTRTQGHPQAFSFRRGEGESSSRASLAQQPAPGLLQGRDLPKPSKEVSPPDPSSVPMAREPRIPPALQRSRLKAEEKTLDFEFELVSAQFNQHGQYALRLTVENPLLQGSGAGIQLRIDSGEVVQSSTGTTDIIEQSDLDQIYSFQRRRFIFTLPRGKRPDATGMGWW